MFLPYQLIPTIGSLQIVLLSIVCIIVIVLWTRPKNLPPGPKGLPVVGNLLSLFKDGRGTALVYTDWSKKYGDVFTVYFGPKPAIVLNSYAAVHDALVKNSEVFSSRPANSASFTPDQQTRGIAQEHYGPKLKELRRFTLMSLRDFGLGKRSLEGKILEEARALGDEISKNGGQAFCISRMMQNAVSNVICSIVFGCRYEYEEIQFKELLATISDIFSASLEHFLALMIRPLRFIPGFRKPYRQYRHSQATVMNHIKKRIQQHAETFDPSDIRDFMDAFLLESKKRQVDLNTTFTEQQHATVVYQLFLAGTDTTSMTLRWALLYMILHPDIQEKVHQEIDSVLGSDQEYQEPSMADRAQMPYTEATLAEVSRLATVAPTAIMHATSDDATFRGYTIPKDTLVVLNIWSVHRDPQLWPEPSKFDPTRFLDDTGNYVKRKEVIPFSMGRRVCVGEQLARMELFLIFTSLLQRFTFKLPEGAPKPAEEGHFGLGHPPEPFKLIAEARD